MNKIDLRDQEKPQVTFEDIKDFAEKNNIPDFVACSSLTQQGLKDLFDTSYRACLIQNLNPKRNCFIFESKIKNLK